MAALLFASATVGCGGNAASRRPATTAVAVADDDVASGLMEHHRYHHHGGVTLFIAMSLDTLGVPPEKRAAIETIRVHLHAGVKAARVAEQDLAAVLAEGLAAGSFDAAKVDAAVAQITTTALAVNGATIDALNQLHAVLTPLERAALVDKVESHWAVWRKANTAETGATKGGDDDHLSVLATELELTESQLEKIRASLTEGMKGVPRLDPQEVATHLRAFGEAFRSDTFDAKGLTTETTTNAHLVGWGATHLVHVVEAVSPVLTPDQRAQLAEKLREHAAHNPSARESHEPS